MAKTILLLTFAVLLFIAIADIGVEAQRVYPQYPIWLLIPLIQLGLVVSVYRMLKR